MTSCAGCPPATSPGGQHVGVPLVTQYASPDLIERFAYQGLDPSEDPNWASAGWSSAQEYGQLSRHCCGMACLRMALLHRDGTAAPLSSLFAGALESGAYQWRDGSLKGLIYAPFSDWAASEHRLPAGVHPALSLHQIADYLVSGHLVIASVHKEIRRPHLPAPGQGGHLVLITGMDESAGTITLHNPSGHTPETRQATLPQAAFATFFAGRGLSLDLAKRD